MMQLKVPKGVKLFYNKKTNVLIWNYKNNFKLIKLEFKLLLDIKKKKLYLTRVLAEKSLNKTTKQLIFVQKLIFFEIKTTLLELLNTYYQKLKFVGIGYKALTVHQIGKKNIFLLKLGISHSLYLSTNFSSEINLFCLKFTKLFVFGSSYKELSQTSANIRLQKWPEPYKGKGILFENEKINLKEGKRV